MGIGPYRKLELMGNMKRSSAKMRADISINSNWWAFLRTVGSNKEDNGYASGLALLGLCLIAVLIIAIAECRFVWGSFMRKGGLSWSNKSSKITLEVPHEKYEKAAREAHEKTAGYAYIGA